MGFDFLPLGGAGGGLVPWEGGFLSNLRSIIVSMPSAAPAKKKACAAYQSTVSEISPTGGRNMFTPDRRKAVKSEKPAHHSRKVMFFII